MYLCDPSELLLLKLQWKDQLSLKCKQSVNNMPNNTNSWSNVGQAQKGIAAKDTYKKASLHVLIF